MPDKLVAPSLGGIDGQHELFGMLFENADMICTQNHQRQFAALQILLIFEALIGRDHDVKPVIFSGLQKIAVGKPRPALFRRRPDVVCCEIGPELIRDVLIEQDAQIAGFRRTVLRQ